MQVNYEVLHFLDSLNGVEDTICEFCGSRIQPPNATLFYVERRWEVTLPYCAACRVATEVPTYGS
jgi:hypothetical protein